MWTPPEGSFTVQPIGFKPWSTPDVKPVEPAWRSDDTLKRAFGIALAKLKKPFDAGLDVFPNDTGQALWASVNWAHDPLVLASRDIYLDTVGISNNLLSKEQLAAKLLAFAEEKDVSGRFYICEAKDRLAALKLYSEVQGFTGPKVNVDLSSNFTNNELKLVLVSAPQQETKVIEAEAEEVSAPVLPHNLKLVNSR